MPRNHDSLEFYFEIFHKCMRSNWIYVNATTNRYRHMFQYVFIYSNRAVCRIVSWGLISIDYYVNALTRMLSERKSRICFKIDNGREIFENTMEAIDDSESRPIEATITFYSIDNERHHRYAMGIVSFCWNTKICASRLLFRLVVLFRFDLR